jgi:hypothetical protein
LAREVTLFERKKPTFFFIVRGSREGQKEIRKKNNAPHLKIIYSHELAPYK